METHPARRASTSSSALNSSVLRAATRHPRDRAPVQTPTAARCQPIRRPPSNGRSPSGADTGGPRLSRSDLSRTTLAPRELRGAQAAPD